MMGLRTWSGRSARSSSGRSDCWNSSDTDNHCIVNFLDKINDHAEARLAAKQQARAEAQEIRMREVERMQRESEVNRSVHAGSVVTPRSLLSSNNSSQSYHLSRRSSEDSLEEINNIQDVRREHKETCRLLEQTKRHCTELQEDLDTSHSQLSELLQLIQEKGLVVVEGDCSSSDEESEGAEPRPNKAPKKALVSSEVADVLDVWLKKFVEERNKLHQVKLELEEERAHSRGRHPNGPTDDSESSRVHCYV